MAGHDNQDRVDAIEQDAFVAEFRRWRDVRGLSRAALARQMRYSRPYVSKVEGGTENASIEFAQAAETVLNTGGALRRAWREQYSGHPKNRRPEAMHIPATSAIEGGSLIVEHDQADLVYDQGVYRATMRRRLSNNGQHPIST